MEVTLAKTAGFCFGVKRAVDMVYEACGGDKKAYTYGPIIHNDAVVEDLKKRGVEVVSSLDELPPADGQAVMVIRSHGVSQEEYQRIREAGFTIIDATCPFVKKIHRNVNEKSRNGAFVVIIGNDGHPEVEGIKGWCNGGFQVLGSEEQAREWDYTGDKNVFVVSQTTFNYKKFKDIVEIISKKGYDILALNTICNATEERQTEARKLARDSDAMIVIGGKQSSNTQKLYEICKEECDDTYYIQTLVDLNLDKLRPFRSVGITAGASTPNNIIKEVQMHVRNEF